MKLTIPRPSLVEALQTCAPAAKGSRAIPILSHVLLTATPDRLSFRATDCDVTITTLCIATVEEAGGATVEMKSLLGLARSLEADDVALESIQGRLRVTAGRSEYELPSLPADDFPVPEEVENVDPIEVGAEDFRVLMKSSAFAMGDDADGVFCRGAWLSAKSKQMTLYATNGKRMVCRRVSAGGNLNSAFIPSHGVKAAAALAPISTEVMGYLIVGENHAEFRFLDTSLLIRRGSDSPLAPDFAAESKKHASREWVKGVNTPSLLAAIRRAIMMVRDDGPSNASSIMAMNIEPGTIRLAAVRTDSAAKEELGADADFSLDLEVKAQYVAEFLESLDSDRVAIGTNGQNKPITFREIDEIADSEPTVEYILMPIFK